MTATEPWEPLPDESPEAAEAFIAYRDMGNERTTRGVAQQLSKSGQLIRRWSSQHGWVQRVALYDLELDRKRRKAAEAELESMAKRHAQIAAAATMKVAARVQSMNPDEIPASQVGTTLRQLVDVERLSRGASTSHVEVSGGLTTSTEWADMRELLVRALAPHPEALADVLAVLSPGSAT